jgi:hypothetical protein
MVKVIASGPSNNDAESHVYLVRWEGCSHKETTWETFENLNENAKELWAEYYTENANMQRDKRFGKEKLRQKDAGGAGKRKSRKRREE